MTNKQYKAVKRTRLNEDSDGDGVPNKNDCRPFDRNRQDTYIVGADALLHSAYKMKERGEITEDQYQTMVKRARRLPEETKERLS